jgi:hypothetical protein
MPTPFTILNKTEDGKVNGTAIRKFFDGLKPGRYELSAKRLNKRSLQQNAYLHAVLIPEFRKALNEVGYNEVKTNEQAKLIMKSMFLTRSVEGAPGSKPVHYVQDTHDLTKEEMSTLIDEVIQFAAENLNYVIPYPNEQTLLWQ